MNIGSVVNQSLIGMQNSRAEMTQSAQQIAQTSIGDNSADMTTPLVNLRAQQQVFDSSAKVLEVADQAIGALLDIKA